MVDEKISSSFNPAKVHVATTTNGQLKTSWFEYNHQLYAVEFSFKLLPSEKSQNWQTHTFRYPENTQFDIDALKHWLSTINITRLKGLIQTSEGYYLLNYSAGQIDITQPDNQLNSYIEVIDLKLNIASLESGISNCIVS